ncbi:Translation initiation factor IF-2 [Pontiella desulfatans]|uniref:Translation initiation factor IF-2 n=1 Tax=Pontiella desulfatans TaxID=2750659 RepID=A0A6C2UAM3_PONDE|nr:translation initiation factor IF-2 [Pontiella desulfatans]VGO17158.1 Translation initiation factor IF-2 [Pontiella desulfatans]
MMTVQETAKDVGVSAEELIEILGDIDIVVDGPESELTKDQITQVCDELGYGSIEDAREDNVSAEEEEEPEAAPAEEVKEEAAPVAAAEEAPVEEAAAEEVVAKEAPPAASDEPAKDPTLIELKKPKVIVKDFAEMMGMKPNMVIAELMRMNVFASINAEIDLKIAKQIGEKHGFTVRKEEKKKAAPQQPKTSKKVQAKKLAEAPDTPDALLPRPPVVTFMGHVDHGKTSLLDKVRNTRVTAGESGGITQHIGAYTVELNDHKITFLDTPGHAAFTAMRARGANLTDIAVLVVAADDGVMPQTIEAIKHAKAAGVCTIIAMNKMDLRAANPDRLKQQLQENEIMVEDWGGDIGCIPVSAETGEGIDSLLERILLESEMLELKANPNKPATGFVVEAQMEPGMGPTASVLVKSGTLKVGDNVICGNYWGRIKALISDQGKKIRTAGPSTAVKILGLTNVPGAGDEFQVLASDKEAKALSEELQAEERAAQLGGGAAPKKMSLDDLFGAGAGDEKKELKVIIKADVQGSVEAIAHSLGGIKSDKVEINIITNDVGNITVNDVMLASASDAIILGFHTGNENGTNAAAKREGVEIRLYSIIYELIEDVESAMKGLLEPELREQVIGEAEVREVFELSKKSKIAGCMVMSGRITSKASIRIKRGRDILFEGLIGSLKRFQNDAAEVRQGQECGIRPENFTNFEAGDTIQAYIVEKITQEL